MEVVSLLSAWSWHLRMMKRKSDCVFSLVGDTEGIGVAVFYYDRTFLSFGNG
ncbi:MAG: hypothetical protein LUH18_06035 [Oscillospiraceae bacterium]|nr:hypothetical protein [Oscillospiraceae bacterium]